VNEKLNVMVAWMILFMVHNTGAATAAHPHVSVACPLSNVVLAD
jgi:hypothetical protein